MNTLSYNLMRATIYNMINRKQNYDQYDSIYIVRRVCPLRWREYTKIIPVPQIGKLHSFLRYSTASRSFLFESAYAL